MIGGPQKTLSMVIGMAMLAAACTGSQESQTEPSTAGLASAEVAGDESAAAAESTTAQADTDDSPAAEATPEPLTIDAKRGDAIERVLVSYTEAINERRAEDAYALFTDALRERVPLDDLVDGTSTSFISRLSVAQVTFDDQTPAGPDGQSEAPDEQSEAPDGQSEAPDEQLGATVIASFRTDQAPELGRDGQACSIWELEYRMIDLDSGVDTGSDADDAESAGDWRIDQATPLGGSPFPCPVIAPEPTEQEPAEEPTPGRKPVVHLTLDDGPGPETERFLDLFAEFNVEATFFVNSNRIAGRAPVTRRIVEDGHAIANHTHTHCNLQNPAALTPSSLCATRTAASEIEDVQRIVAETTGVTPTCFRPPYGAQSADTRALIDSYGLRNWLWDIDTNDWRFNANNADYSDAQAVAELDKAATLRPSHGSTGVIILLHDGTASAPRMLRLLRTWLEANESSFDFRAIDSC